MRPTPARAGGGRDRAVLVERSLDSIEEGSRSFAAASKLFDRPTRERSWLLYAWCRRCDDIADNQEAGRPRADSAGKPLDMKTAEDRVQAIRVLTRRAFEAQPTADPAFDALGLVADECGLTLDEANDVIGGFALDATGWKPATEKDMLRYCYHVAGAVGIMVARIMGVHPDDGETLDRACDLGIAFQLANIGRDIVEDDAIDRCYLPQSWLDEMGWTAGEQALPENRFRLASLMPRLITMMERHECAARQGTRHLRFRQRWAVLAAANIYGAIGRRVLARGQTAWDRRVAISGPEKLWHIITAFFAALWNRPAQPDEPILWSRHDFRPVAGW